MFIIQFGSQIKKYNLIIFILTEIINFGHQLGWASHFMCCFLLKKVYIYNSFISNENSLNSSKIFRILQFNVKLFFLAQTDNINIILILLKKMNYQHPKSGITNGASNALKINNSANNFIMLASSVGQTSSRDRSNKNSIIQQHSDIYSIKSQVFEQKNLFNLINFKQAMSKINPINTCILETSSANDLYLSKRYILNYIRQKMKQPNHNCFLFYSGYGLQDNGDWSPETFECSGGDRIQLTQILSIWKQSKQQGCRLIIVMDSCSSGEWCHRLAKDYIGNDVAIFASCSKLQTNQSGHFFNEIFGGNVLNTKIKQLIKQQTPIYVSFSRQKFRLLYPHLQKINQNLQFLVNLSESCVIQEQKGVYKGQYPGHKEGFGIFEYKDGGIYHGEWRNDRKQGQGTMTYQNNYIYQGEWKDDKYHGHGSIIYIKDGSNTGYNGNWRFGMRNGSGDYYYPDGGVYKGEWKNDKRNGRGVMTYSTSQGSYDGEWRDDLRNGKGTQFYKDGTKYTGQWRDDRKIEQQDMTINRSAPAQVYRKIVQTQKPMIKVSAVEPALSTRDDKIPKIEFTYKNSQKGPSIKNGVGTKFYPDGGSYEGQWMNGRRHGFGTKVNPDGSRYQGEWRFDKKNGKGLYIYGNNDGTYEGEWRDNKRHGKGVRVYGNGKKVVGDWVYDKRIQQIQQQLLTGLLTNPLTSPLTSPSTSPLTNLLRNPLANPLASPSTSPLLGSPLSSPIKPTTPTKSTKSVKSNPFEELEREQKEKDHPGIFSFKNKGFQQNVRLNKLNNVNNQEQQERQQDHSYNKGREHTPDFDFEEDQSF